MGVSGSSYCRPSVTVTDEEWVPEWAVSPKTTASFMDSCAVFTLERDAHFGIIYKEGRVLKRGDSWPYFWAMRKLYLYNTTLVYSDPLAGSGPDSPRGVKWITPKTVIWKPDNFLGYPRCLLVFEPPEGVSRYTSSDADLLKAFARAEFPKFALHMPSDCALDKWDEALKEAIKLAKRLKDGDVMDAIRHRKSLNVATTSLRVANREIARLKDEMVQHHFAPRTSPLPTFPSTRDDLSLTPRNPLSVFNPEPLPSLHYLMSESESDFMMQSGANTPSGWSWSGAGTPHPNRMTDMSRVGMGMGTGGFGMRPAPIDMGPLEQIRRLVKDINDEKAVGKSDHIGHDYDEPLSAVRTGIDFPLSTCADDPKHPTSVLSYGDSDVSSAYQDLTDGRDDMLDDWKMVHDKHYEGGDEAGKTDREELTPTDSLDSLNDPEESIISSGRRMEASPATALFSFARRLAVKPNSRSPINVRSKVPRSLSLPSPTVQCVNPHTQKYDGR